MFHEAISWIEARHSYKNALRAGRQQKNESTAGEGGEIEIQHCQNCHNCG